MRAWLRILIALLIVALPVGSARAQAVMATAGSPPNGWSCWDDGTADPCHNRLNDLVFSAADEAWAVGNAGTILAWDGEVWQKVSSPTLSDLNTVTFTSPTSGWAVGDEGHILRYDGTDWETAAVTQEGDRWLGVSFLGSASGWAVGKQAETGKAIFARFDGESWTRVQSDTFAGLAEVAVAPNGEAWAIADAGNQILHWNGSAWSQYTQLPDRFTINYFTALAVDSSGVVWLAVGGSFPAIFRLVEGSWQRSLIDAGSTPDSLAVVGPNDAWVYAYMKLYHWNGTAWSLVANDPENTQYNIHFHDLAADPSGDVWGIYDNPAGFQVWDGSAWEQMDLAPGSAEFLLGLDFSSPARGWAVGVSGEIWAWDGTDWSAYASPTWKDLRAVDSVSEDQVWSVGYQGIILFWNGQSWNPQTSGTDKLLMDVDMLSAGDGWAVGDGATLLRWDGSNWQQTDIYPGGVATPDLTLTSIQMVSATDGWIVGHYPVSSPYGRKGSVVLRWDGLRWQDQDLEGIDGQDSRMELLSMVSADLGWITEEWWDGVKSWQRLWRWDGESWTQEPTLLDASVASIEMLSPSRGWLSGQNKDLYDMGSLIYRYTGEGFSRIYLPSDTLIVDFEMLADGSGWAVGRNGAFLRYELPNKVFLPVAHR